ncbi:MAG: hypothetical protein ACPHRO_15405, partial [Nannocystaceae bacterium]
METSQDPRPSSRRTPAGAHRRRGGRGWWRFTGLCVALLTGRGAALGPQEARAAGVAQTPAAVAPGTEERPRPAPASPTWRFKEADRPVKVVVLAGSIGAWHKHSYPDQLEQLCERVEV